MGHQQPERPAGAIAAIQAIARSFVSARASRHALAAYPGPVPHSLADAYCIQDAAIALHGGTIGGWKVGRILAPAADLFGADRLSGPIFADTLQRVAEGDNPMPIIPLGFAAAEAEILLQVGTLPADPATVSLEEAAACIRAAHLGIEIASSPFPGINAMGPAVTVSDFGNNFGLLIGPAIPDWVSLGFEACTITALLDGAIIGTGTSRAMPDGVLGAARFLFQNLAGRGRSLAPGQWISTGAVTGVHPVRPGQHFEARLGDGISLSCTLVAG